MLNRILVTLMLVVAGCNLVLAIDGDADPLAARLARAVLFIFGVTTAWPLLGKERR
jgi:hypothetical protein